MFSYIARRALLIFITVLGAIILLFILFQFMPGDMATILLGPRASESLVESYRVRMGLDQPVYIQIIRYLGNVLRGDLGTDVLNHIPVSSLIMNVLPNTIILAFSAIFMACLIGIPLGVFSASNQGSFFDYLTGFLSISMITIPHFLAGILLLLIFAVYLGWFPAMGGGQSGDIMNQFYHLILPATALGLGWVGYIARLTRATVLEELRADYVRTARAKGLKERVVLYKHVLRCSIIPVIAVIGVGFGNLMGGAVLVEIVFHRPGLGYMIYRAISTRNFPVLQGGLIVAIFLYALANFAADLSYVFIDPRVRGE